MRVKKNRKTNQETPSIVLPSDSEQGFLIVGRNKSALFINSPDKGIADEYTLEKIKEKIGDRALEKYAKNKGQSGFKFNTNHTATIKLFKEKVRIDCVLGETKKVKYGNQIFNVPSYTPTLVRKK